MADYLPMTTGMKLGVARESDFSKTYLEELACAEARNLAPAPNKDWKNGLDFLHCASIVHPRWRQATHVHGAERDRVAEIFAQFCMKEYKRTFPTKDLNAEMEPATNTDGVVAEPSGNTTRPLTPSQRLEARLPAVPKAAAEVAAPVQPPVSRTLASAIDKQVTHWMSLAPAVGSDKPLEWWKANEGEWWAIAPAARALLVFGSGNASLERLFSRAIRIFGDKCRKGADIKRAMMLCHSAWRLGMCGYYPPQPPKVKAKDTSEKADDESDDESDDQDIIIQRLEFI